MANFYDIDIGFNLDASGDLLLATDNDAIVQSIENIIFTPRSFKCGFGGVNRVFGLGMRKYVFAPLTAFVARSLGEDIYRQLRMFEPRIEVTNVDVQINIDDRAFIISVTYKINPINNQYTFRTVINQL